MKLAFFLEVPKNHKANNHHKKVFRWTDTYCLSLMSTIGGEVQSFRSVC